MLNSQNYITLQGYITQSKTQLIQVPRTRWLLNLISVCVHSFWSRAGNHIMSIITVMSNECLGMSHHQSFGRLCNNLFGLTSKKHQTSALLALCEGNLLVDWWIPLTKGSVMRKVFSFPDVIMVIYLVSPLFTGTGPKSLLLMPWLLVSSWVTTSQGVHYVKHTAPCPPWEPISPTHAILHIEAKTKWPPFSRRRVQMHFLECKHLNFEYNLTEVCS